MLRQGGVYFFTVVTYRRRPLFTSSFARECLHEAFLQQHRTHPFDLFAICLLPDHLHCVWCLPKGDADYSARWQSIKRHFTQRYLDGGGSEGKVSAAEQREGRKGVWQPRFLGTHGS
ncbi:REP-associated tyrosine transposase [Rhodopirellula halodulae]|uniref:REP-associated tyrosine transposase n=1 Tax=Rhodopirellula halodulae TaxID=2894198 RepID=UPI001E40F8C8|nr:transposase [Rhodopirellula sp. JC737]